MESREFKELFTELDFDVAEPAKGHQERFLKRLKENKEAFPKKGKVRKLWTPILAVAASLLVIIMLAGNFLGPQAGTNSGDLADISPEMKETQLFYTSLINTELEKVNAAKSPETEAVVNDALAQLEKLDVEYEKLKKDLVNSGQDNRVIFAMVSNLQQRIDVLNNVLTRIEEIKQFKNPDYENNII